MSDTETFSTRFSNYQPTKTLWVWSMIGIALATMVLGFTMGGWTTDSRANQMADAAAKEATSDLVASICVQKFIGSTDAAASFVTLKETSSWKRDDFIEEGGWLTIVGLDDKVDGAADRCASTLAGMTELPVAETVADAT